MQRMFMLSFLFLSSSPTPETTICPVTTCNSKNTVEMNVLWTSGFRIPLTVNMALKNLQL